MQCHRLIRLVDNPARQARIDMTRSEKDLADVIARVQNEDIKLEVDRDGEPPIKADTADKQTEAKRSDAGIETGIAALAVFEATGSKAKDGHSGCSLSIGTTVW